MKKIFKQEKKFVFNSVLFGIATPCGYNVVMNPEDQTIYFIMATGVIMIIYGLVSGLKAITRVLEIRIEYLEHVDKFKTNFNNVTGLDLSLKEFIRYVKKFTGKSNIDYYNVDYKKLEKYIKTQE